jgi:hypothetical protein
MPQRGVEALEADSDAHCRGSEMGQAVRATASLQMLILVRALRWSHNSRSQRYMVGYGDGGVRSLLPARGLVAPPGNTRSTTFYGATGRESRGIPGRDRNSARATRLMLAHYRRGRPGVIWRGGKSQVYARREAETRRAPIRPVNVVLTSSSDILMFFNPQDDCETHSASVLPWSPCSFFPGRAYDMC